MRGEPEASTHPSTDVTLLGTAHADASQRPAASEEREPTRLGRYAIVGRLGEGAMGSVYEARDVDLGRAVALKLVRGDLSRDARQRMQREALALARLSHPHVVPIYEIGRADDGRTFIAMELVRGRTLDDWRRGTPRPGWREVLSLLAQAGEGLAAAHAEGLVHRDFKPSNCMLGDDGRVRVVDFGLAKDAAEVSDDVTLASGEIEPSEPALTRTGAILGTPAYMAPEQLGHGAVDARADQFGFCVTLYEALYGERPFEGRTLGELYYAITVAGVRSPPRDAAVPSWVRKVVLRGLSAEPSARWPSMRALLDALADDPALRRRKHWTAAGVVVLLVGGAVGVTVAVQHRAEQCQGAEARLEGAWDSERRAAVEQAILGSGRPHAAGTWARVGAQLDGYGQAWASAYQAACEATREGEQSAALLDLRMACLDERRLHLRALVDELSRADAEVVDRAVTAAMGLPTLARCEDAEALRAEVEPPDDPAVASRVAELDALLVEASAKLNAGRHREGLVVAEAVAADADRLAYAPLQARAWLYVGLLRDETGRYEAAKAALERVYDIAVAHRMIDEAAHASTKLVLVVGRRMGHYEEAQSWVTQADPWSLAARSDAARARYYRELGTLAYSRTEYELARDSYERALAIKEAMLGPEHPDVAHTLHDLSNVMGVLGDHAKSRETYERALAIEEAALGPEHPDPARGLVSLGNLVSSQGDYAGALALIERGTARLEASLGPEHPDVARAQVNLASAVEAMGDHARARAQRKRALVSLTEALGPDHPEVAIVLINLGYGALQQGEHETARGYLERALAIQTEVLEPQHLHLAYTLHNLGTAANGLGQHEEARGHLERALAIEEAKLGPEHPDVAGVLTDLAIAVRELGEPAEARALLERALTLKEKGLGAEHPALAPTLEGLGELAEDAGDHERALEHFERALVLSERILGRDHPDLVAPLVGLGRARVDLGRAPEAIDPLERAVALGITHAVDPVQLAAGRFALARALRLTPGEGHRGRARELAELARSAYVDLGEVTRAELAEVDAWLLEHRAG